LVIQKVEEIEILILRAELFVPLGVLLVAAVIQLLQTDFDLKFSNILLLLLVLIVKAVRLVLVGRLHFLDALQEVSNFERFLAVISLDY